jgi:hypothetical protein
MPSTIDWSLSFRPAGFVGSGIEFDDRGSHELKGVPDAWQLFAVAG